MAADSGFEVTLEDLQRTTRVLEAIARDSLLLSGLSQDDRLKLLMAAGQVISPEKAEVRRRLRAQRRSKREQKQEHDRQVRAKTSIRVARRDSVFVAPPRTIAIEDKSARELEKPKFCYVCKEPYTRLHHFYDALCPSCAVFNYEKRFQTASLEGRTALITGARLKIGYQASLMMLRAGARVIVTTRFPRDSAIRYAREDDFAKWAHRLQIHGLDLRHSPSVELFARFIDRTETRLDILINNAAQTVRRPPGFYAHLMELERLPYNELPRETQALLGAHETCKRELAQLGDSTCEGTRWLAAPAAQAPGLSAAAEVTQLAYPGEELPGREVFPEGRLDADLQQLDLRRMNSWRMRLADVPTAEMIETQLINSIAPFILCSKLKPLMMRERTDEKHIVNVSAMEGKFARRTKTDKHPHTNMAKAALNMMTLTSARDYAADGIFMNAVDTGWVTDEDPAEISARKQAEQDFQPPLDIVDGAARVMDPVFSGLLTGKHCWGNFLKDYAPTEW
jgi:NAD(P)-dependent dehydrogenase (short-subunit alcohol dehydrogenase family)